MILSFSAGCGRRNSARRALPGESVGRKGRWGPLGLFCGLPPGPAALPGESVGRKGIGYPTGDFPLPKPSPRGEGGPAKPGRMRGRSTHPTGQEKEGDGATSPSFYKERLGTESPPHQSPPVTASPQGEASGLCSPTRKSVPNQGTYMGPVIAPPPEQCGTTAKTSEWKRAGHKTGGPGGLPPALFLPISREKWGPRRAGGPPGRCAPRHRKSLDHP